MPNHIGDLVREAVRVHFCCFVLLFSLSSENITRSVLKHMNARFVDGLRQCKVVIVERSLIQQGTVNFD